MLTCINACMHSCTCLDMKALRCTQTCIRHNAWQLHEGFLLLLLHLRLLLLLLLLILFLFLLWAVQELPQGHAEVSRDRRGVNWDRQRVPRGRRVQRGTCTGAVTYARPCWGQERLCAYEGQGYAWRRKAGAHRGVAGGAHRAEGAEKWPSTAHHARTCTE